MALKLVPSALHLCVSLGTERMESVLGFLSEALVQTDPRECEWLKLQMR